MQYLKEAENKFLDNYSNETEETVKEVLNNIKTRKDLALKEYEKKFSKSDRDKLEVENDEIQKSISSLNNKEKEMINQIVYRIKSFAEAQLECLQPFEKDFGNGIKMGHKIIPIEKAGAYIPGGRFPLLSSGPMVVAPAKVAGVKEIIACSPANYNGGIHPAVLYGLLQSGADRIFAVGGAQAVGAMALGTESIPKVNVITGPGNRFVAEAKRQVFGEVGIDLIAGPSEIMILADEHANAELCAADLLAQSEHDPNARAILVSTSRELGEEVIRKVSDLLKKFKNDSPAHESWAKNGEVIIAESIEEGIKLCNDYAIEHLHLHVKNSNQIKDELYNYGSLFIGENSSVVFSDKVSGTNHTLPTQEASKYTGGLWVGNYVKVLTHQEIHGDGVNLLAQHASEQSEMEGLEGHKLSATLRLKQ